MSVKAVIYSDGTIANMGRSDWSGSLQVGQTQVDLGDIAIPNNAILGYIVQSGALAQRATALTTDTYSRMMETTVSFWPAIQANAAILAQIDSLEAAQTLRRMREATNGTDNGWLKNLEIQIAALRSQLQKTS